MTRNDIQAASSPSQSASPLERLQLTEPLRRSLGEENLDWNRIHPTLADGSIDRSVLPPPPWGIKPMPVMGPVSTAMLEAAERDLLKARKPCQRDAFEEMMARLSVVFPIGEMSEHGYSLMWDEYFRAIGHLPQWVIQDAVRQYQRDPSNEFFPKPGQLLQLAQPLLKETEKLLFRVKSLLGKTDPEPTAAAPASTEFYGPATLRGVLDQALKTAQQAKADAS